MRMRIPARVFAVLLLGCRLSPLSRLRLHCPPPRSRLRIPSISIRRVRSSCRRCRGLARLPPRRFWRCGNRMARSRASMICCRCAALGRRDWRRCGSIWWRGMRRLRRRPGAATSTTKPATCASCSRAAPVKKAALASARLRRPRRRRSQSPRMATRLKRTKSRSETCRSIRLIREAGWRKHKFERTPKIALVTNAAERTVDSARDSRNGSG